MFEDVQQQPAQVVFPWPGTTIIDAEAADTGAKMLRGEQATGAHEAQLGICISTTSATVHNSSQQQDTSLPPSPHPISIEF
jgi:hypothetical protein